MEEGREVYLHGGDAEVLGEFKEGHLVVNMGPQHPSTHGVLRIVLELDGERVVSAEPVIGYLHTGIEKNCEYRNWVQAVTFVTRMDYLAPLFNELAYCLAVERLLGIEPPPRAQVLRVLLTELNRISSHLVWLATTAGELGSMGMSLMLYGFREREDILDVFEMASGLRMNHAYFRPGGLAADLPPEAEEKVRAILKTFPTRFDEYEAMLSENPIWLERTKGVGILPAEEALSLGVTGPNLRASGVPFDVRKVRPYSGLESYQFEIPVGEVGDVYDRYWVRMREMRESLRIVAQALERLEPGPIMVEDPKIAWPARLAVGPDGLGNDPLYLRKIMAESMEALIHHFKLVTEGFHVPAGEVFVAVESPRGLLGYRVVSDGGTRPYRVRVREPSFVNLQALPVVARGGLVADLVAAAASLDPVMGGVDR